MERPDDPEQETNEPETQEPETQEQRALRSLQAIFGGADLTAEATQLANDFTDRHSGRIGGWFKRKRGETKESAG